MYLLCRRFAVRVKASTEGLQVLVLRAITCGSDAEGDQLSTDRGSSRRKLMLSPLGKRE